MIMLMSHTFNKMDEDDALPVCSSCVSLDKQNDSKNTSKNYHFPAGIDLGTSYGSYLHSSTSPRKPHPKVAAAKSYRDNHRVSSIPKLPAVVTDSSIKREVIRHEESASDHDDSIGKPFNFLVADSCTSSTRKCARFSSSVSTIYMDLQLLIESLVDLKGRLKYADIDSSVLRAACNTLAPAYRELRTVVERLDQGGDDPLITAETLQLVMVYIQTIMQALIDQTEHIQPTGGGSREEWNQFQQEQIKALMHYHQEKEAELKALKRVCRTTEAELEGTRKYCDKLKQYLTTTEEKAAADRSELRSQLEAARSLLVSVTRELDEERTKAQEIKLLACQKDRELKQVIKHTGPVRKPLEKEIHRLQNELERQQKLGRQLRSQIHDDSVKIKHLQSKFTSSRNKHGSRPFAGQSQQRSNVSQAMSWTPHMAHQHWHIPSTSSIFVACQQPARTRVNRDHVKLKPLSFTSAELAEMAYFPDSSTANETMNILKKQGILRK